MYINKLRSMLMVAIVAAVLLVGSVAPASAAPKAQLPPIGNPAPITFQCYMGGQAWPLGTKVQAPGGGYFKCELRASLPGGLHAAWVYHAN